MGMGCLDAFTAAMRSDEEAAEGDIGYRFVQFTDIHMEPFYNPENGHAKGDVCRVSEAFNKSQCIPFRIEPEASIYPFGRLNCDAPHALVRSLFEHITRVGTEAAKKGALFGIFTGDIPSHQLSCQRHQAHTIEFVISHMARNLKPVLGNIYPAMGNNDYFPNYNVSLEPNSPWQELVASMYEAHGLLEGSQVETFRRGGFYVATPVPGLKLLVLNTVAWSEKVLNWASTTKVEVVHIPEDDEATYSGPDAPLPRSETSGWTWNTDSADKKAMVPCENRPTDPYGQLAWMRAELAQARGAGERVIIAGHVPPGNKVGDNNLCAGHANDLQDISREYQDIIEVQLYGDHSNDEFRMVWSEAPRPHAVSSVLVSAGVTPRKHCNPSWRLFEVSKDHRVYDFTQFFLPLTATDMAWSTNPKWTELHLRGKDESLSWRFWKKQYSFRELYGVGLSPPELEGLWAKMQTDPELLKEYLKNMFSQTVGTQDYFDYMCDMRYLDDAENSLCAQRGQLLHGESLNLLKEGTWLIQDSVGDSSSAESGYGLLCALIASCSLNLVLSGAILTLWARRFRARPDDSYVQIAESSQPAWSSSQLSTPSSNPLYITLAVARQGSPAPWSVP
eukprot:CAMPEP_0115086134 /NCGR_PEP_ID=MMETSP0227-20121206/22383_1 /TAXON_ID=89957 /ORGANISM="Polarella glacialis, Strain CCMP 1383" /LENGTH=617 /DNA_ID=CAMNT_0002475491 /DNA_START=83 /DNA_END=1938 /DNA_ORIENTATION=-